jgi:predicted DCC family thiol-disulfide oxidoreductase YuxK
MTTSQELQLPDPDDRPEADVVIWDGKCNFCRSQVARLRWFDRRSQLAYVSLHDPRVAERYPDLSYQQLMDQLWLVTHDGRRLGGADAGRYLSRKIFGLWWLAPLLHIPGSMPLWRWIYQKVAQRRYRLLGGACDADGTCHVHLPDSQLKSVESPETSPDSTKRLGSAEKADRVLK